jgi:hypothetical protein
MKRPVKLKFLAVLYILKLNEYAEANWSAGFKYGEFKFQKF